MELMERLSSADRILKDLYDSLSGEFVLNYKMIYQYLIFMNIKDEDRTKDIRKEFFDKWISRFSNTANIKVFWKQSFEYFCQFTNGDVSYDCYKVYIPLDYNHLYEGANLIFDFLAANNIQHSSKIANKVRFDNVVVRLNTYEDVCKLQSFINNNKYIREGLIKKSPFAFNTNGVSYCYDGNLSYNSTVSGVIVNYLNYCRKNKMDITQVGIDGFKTYLEQYGNNSEMLASLVADNPKKNAVVYASLVVHLLKNALKSNDMKVYHECVSQYIKMDKDKLVVSDLAKGDSRSKEDKILLFNELITVMMKKYHKGFNYRNRDMSGVDYIMAYLKGNTKAITRDNNLRDRVEKNLSSGDITSILLSSGVKGKYLEEKLKNYVDMVMNNKTTKTVENKEALFNEMILTMMKKFYKGYDNTKPWLSGIDYIRQYLNGNIKAITRDNGLRDRVEKDLSSGDIASILLSSGVSGKNLNEQLENYINKVMLDEIIRCSCVRLGDDGITQVERFMAVNDLSLITNRIGQARELAKTMDAERMRNYLNSIGYSSVSQYYYSLEENERKEGFRRR